MERAPPSGALFSCTSPHGIVIGPAPRPLGSPATLCHGRVMKKQRKRKPNRAKQKQQPTPAKPVDRRAVLRNGLIGAAVIGAGGLVTTRIVMAAVAEQDLSRVGQGKPAIVQVHDPSCSSCQQLQRETKAALDRLNSDDLIYLVANLTGHEGATFANRYGAPHVTLLLFDGAGALRGTLNGVRSRDELQAVFTQLLETG